MTRMLLSLALVLHASLLFAGDGPEVTLPLFDGKTLHGWNVENDCKASVRDGALLLEAGDGWLRSDHQYRDFRLHVEWKALQEQEYDAGIYVRTLRGGKPFPKRGYQINLLQGQEGNGIGLKGATSTGLVKPAGEWNAFDVTVVGERIALEINGKPAWDVKGLEIPAGYVGFQVEVPKGGQFLVRDVQITELGYRSLFDGESLAGWEGAGKPADICWTVEEGVLKCTGKRGGPWLRTADQFGDFNFRFEYAMSPGGNSGVYVRVPQNGKHHRGKESDPPAGFEVQLLDDSAKKYRKLKGYQHSAGVYDFVGPTRQMTRPPGEWNTMEIDCRGKRVLVFHNGLPVTRADAETPGFALRQTKGYLGFQNHSSVVRIRRIRIGEAVQAYEDVRPVAAEGVPAE